MSRNAEPRTAESYSRRQLMNRIHGVIVTLATPVLLMSGLPGCSAAQAPAPDPGTNAATTKAERWSHQDWPTGPYRVVENWPKPLPDTRHSHKGWTWGSFGGVYAETPDRIWIAM